MSYNNHQLNIPNQPNTATSTTTTTTTITHHQSDHNNQPKITSRPTGLTLDQLTSSISVSIPTCANCSTQTTPLWRRDESGATLCNACALFQKMKGRPRPISLKTDVIKQRNRIKAIDRDLHHHHHHHHHHSHSHSHSKLNKPTTQQNPKSKSHKNIKLISQHPPPPSPTPPLNQSRNLSDQIKIKSSPVSLNENSYHDESEHSFQSTSNDIQESPAFNRSFTNPRKSEPGGVLDLDSPITTSNHPHSLSNEEFNVNQDWISYHSIGSKRRKEIFQSEPISISKRILNGKASQANQFQSILIPDNQQQHPMTLTSIRSHSLNNFRSNGHKNHIRNSLGSTAEFQFDRDLISREEIQSPLHHHRQQQQQQSKLNERNEVMSHLKVPNLNQLSINSNLNLSPITSPLGRSISVDPHSNTQTPVSCSSSSSSSNERGRPRTRLPPLSQLVSRTFNETQSPSRLSGPPISFEESAREASYQSPQPKARVSSNSSSILPTYPLSFQHHPHPLVSQRTSSVSSSKSSDNESWHDSHPTRKPEILKPSTPPLFEEYNRHPSRATEERDEELMRLKQRVNELELINGMMKSKITELESKRQSWDGNSLGSCNLSTSSSAIEIADEDEHHQIDTSW